MRIFLSALDGQQGYTDMKLACQEQGLRIHDGLISYYYLEKHSTVDIEGMLDKYVDHVLVDSGAHSFQKGKVVDWEAYTRRYADYIAKHTDNPRYVGFFEMDVDVVLGYDKVLQLRRILDGVSDKIIPVWHKNRGISEFKRMCHETKGDIVAVTGFHNEDIRDEQYGAFVKYAWECGKKIHCLGMTRQKVLSKVPFDFTDSSSWKQAGNYASWLTYNGGKIKTKKVVGRFSTTDMQVHNLAEYTKLVEYYNNKWAKINHDRYDYYQYFKPWFGTSHVTKLLKILGDKITCKARKTKQLSWLKSPSLVPYM